MKPSKSSKYRLQITAMFLPQDLCTIFPLAQDVLCVNICRTYFVIFKCLLSRHLIVRPTLGTVYARARVCMHM